MGLYDETFGKIANALSGNTSGGSSKQGSVTEGGVNLSGQTWDRDRQIRKDELAAKGLNEDGQPIKKPTKKNKYQKMYNKTPSMRTDLEGTK